MLLSENTIHETHYGVLAIKDDASYDDIRSSYRSAILSSHPDKLEKSSDLSNYDHHKLADRFLKIQKAWEVLSNSRARAEYDSDLRASRRDTVVADNINMEDMMVEDEGEDIELFYQCRCGDYFSVNSVELAEIGYHFSREASKISLQTPDSLPTSIVLPCGSCSLRIRLLLNAETEILLD